MTKNKPRNPPKPRVPTDKIPLNLDALRELGPDRLLFVVGGGVATSPSVWPPIN